MKAYKILQAENAEDLEALVVESMAEGMEPCGGVHVLRYEYEVDRHEYTESRWNYSQAMVAVA